MRTADVRARPRPVAGKKIREGAMASARPLFLVLPPYTVADVIAALAIGE
jgi:hypothetical protein